MPILWGAAGEDQQQDRHMRGLHAPEVWDAAHGVSAQSVGRARRADADECYVVAPAWVVGGLMLCVAVMAGVVGWAARAAIGG